MAEAINKLLDYIRRWKYVETAYDPSKSFSQYSPLHSEKPQFEKLEKIYEWNYDNLKGEWNHISKCTKKGKLCQSVQKYFFAFKRKEDAVAFKLQWGD